MFRFSYFSWIRSVLFSFMSGSGLSDLWPHFFVLCPAPVFRIYDPFEFRFVCFVSRSKVKKFDDQACPFFVHVRSFGSMTSPPPWTVYSDHSCPVSHHLVLFPFEFRFVCFVSRLHVLCPVFGFPSRCNLFSICCLARLLSFCPGYVFRPVFYFLLNWYQKTKFTSLRQYHFICTYMRGWGREGSGRAMAHGWLRLVLWGS